jgi:hypothetical protein
MIEVALTPAEVEISSHVGTARAADSRRRGLNHRPGPHDTDRAHGDLNYWRLGGDLLGACCECAFAKWSGNYWPMSVGATHRDPDVWPDWQIKGRRDPDASLYVRTRDVPTQRFALVIGNLETMTFGIAGWVYAEEAQGIRPANHEGKHWVTQRELHPFTEATVLT